MDINVTSYSDTTAAPNKTFTYKVVANSSPSVGQTVTLPADGNATKLLQPGPADGKATSFSFQTTGTNCNNYGASGGLTIGTDTDAIWRSALGFDLGDIPTGASIATAKLQLWESNGLEAPATVTVNRITRSWKEGTGDAQCTNDGATWDQAEGGINWSSQGGDFDLTPAASLAKAAGQTPHWDEFDVTTLVQKWVNGQAPNLGLLLKEETESPGTRNDIVYLADDHTATPTLRPKLQISYSDGSLALGPTVALSSPGPGSKVSGSVTVAAAASDDRRVDAVDFFVDGAPIGSDATKPFSVTWNSTTVTNAAHTLTARATDDAGNTTTSAGVGFTVENTANPTVQITSPSSGTTITQRLRTVTAMASDDVGVTRVQFLFDDARFAEDADAPYTVTWDTLDPLLPAFDGSHMLTARAIDTSGQATTSAAVPVTLANSSGTKYKASFDLNAAGSTDDPKAVPQAVKQDPNAPTASTEGGTGPAAAVSASSLESPPGDSGTGRDPKAPPPDPLRVDIKVTNNSAVAWKGGDLRVWYRWYTPAGQIVYEGPANDNFPQTVQPGQSKTLPLSIVPPALPVGTDLGLYRLRFDIFDTVTGKWFASAGNKPVDNAVIVNRDLESDLGLERYLHYQGEDVGAGMVHLVNVANGNSLLHWTPFVSPGRGLSTVLDLTYNSEEKGSDSLVGNNWSLSISSLIRLGLPLDVHPNKAEELAGKTDRWIAFTDGDGTTHRFQGKQHADGTIFWEEPPGVHLYLRQFSTTDPARNWAITRPDRVTFFFDRDGYPTSVEDKNGNRITFTLQTVPAGEDPGGPKKRITAVTDAGGRAFTIAYYSKAEAQKPQIRGEVKRITDHQGHALDFEYYEDGNLLRIIQRGGEKADGSFLADRTFVFTYTTSDGSGPAIPAPADRVDPAPRTSNQSTRIYSVRDPRGAETTFAYCSATSCASESQNRWKLQTRTNRTGDQTAFAYDFWNRVTTITAPLSRVTRYAYDTDGKVRTITDPLNRSTQVDWSTDFHVTKVTEQPTGKFTSFTYNDNGYLTSVTDQLGNKTLLEYQNLPVNANDVSGKWKTGRTIPHISQLVKKTNPRGTATATPTNDFQWTFGYDTKGNLTSVTEPEGSPRFTTNYTYNANGTLATLRDANGKITTFNTYDANGLVTKITDAKSQVTQFGYDNDGLLLFIQDPLHASYTGGDPRTYRTYFDYDSFHRMGRQSTPKSTAETAPLIWSAVTYDPNDNVLSQFAAEYGGEFVRGPETTLTYDDMDRVLSSSNPQNEKSEYFYDAAGRPTRITSPKGVATTATNQDFALFYDYDPLDRVIRETRYDTGQSPVKALITHFCYDLAGDLRTVTAPKADVASVSCATPPGFTTSYDYDAAHRLKKETDPLGHATSYGYDLDGNLDSITNASNDTTTRTFDQRGLLSKVVEPLTASRTITTMYRYDGVGNLIKLISPRAYDASSDKVNFTEYVTTNTYDVVNQLTTTELPSKAGEARAYVHRSYDANGNLLVTTLPDPASTLAGVPADSKVTSSYFDTGWVKSTDDHVNPPVSYDYNARGQQSFRRSGSSTPELWRYASDGMVEEHKDRGTQGIVYTYDANNNLASAIDRAGITTPGRKPIEVRVAYDALDRVAKVRNRNEGDTDTNFRFTTFSYDLNSNVTERADNGVETEGGSLVTAPKRHTFAYDQSDWLTSQLDYLASGCQRVENTFTPTAWEATRVVSKASQACDASPSFSVKQSTQWTYLKNGKLDTLTTRSGPVGTGALVESHDVDYIDPAGIYVNGNRVSDVLTKKGPNADCNASSCTETYTYDGRDRLTQERRTPGPTISYTLDASGNVTQKSTPSGTTFFTYSGQRLDKVAQGTATNFVARYVYDPEGNQDCVVVPSFSGSCAAASPTQLIKDYAYDYLNRLASYQSYAAGAVQDQATYDYDPLDRLLKETEKHGSSPTRTTDFSYLGLTNLVAQESQSGDSTKDATKSYSYDAYGHRISLRDDPVDPAKPTKDYTYAYDVHGSVSALVDEAGSVAASYGYDAYGEKDAGLSAGDPEDANPLNPYRYSARRLDSGSGTIDMGARRFGPDVARFLQPDLFLGALTDLGLSTDPLTANRYALAGGNPLSFLEWDGHMPIYDGSGESAPSPNPTDRTFPPTTAAREGGTYATPEPSSGPGLVPATLGPAPPPALEPGQARALLVDWTLTKSAEGWSKYIVGESALEAFARFLLGWDCDPDFGCAPINPGSVGVRVRARVAYKNPAQGEPSGWVISARVTGDISRLNPEAGYELGTLSLEVRDTGGHVVRGSELTPRRTVWTDNGPSIVYNLLVPATSAQQPRKIVVSAGAFSAGGTPGGGPIGATASVEFGLPPYGPYLPRWIRLW